MASKEGDAESDKRAQIQRTGCQSTLCTHTFLYTYWLLNR